MTDTQIGDYVFHNENAKRLGSIPMNVSITIGLLGALLLVLAWYFLVQKKA